MQRSPASPRRLLLLVLLATVAAATPAYGANKVADALEAKLVEAVKARLGLAAETVVRVTNVKPSDRKALAGATSIISVDLPPGERGSGRVTARVTVATKRGEESDLWVMAEVAIELPVVVAARAIRRGAQITPGDVKVERRTDLRVQAFTDPGEVVGREAKQAIREGEVLDDRLVTLPVVIRRGDLVDAIVTGKAFRVRTRAEARESGAVGDVIRVQLTGKERKVVRGRVVSAKEVEVTE